MASSEGEQVPNWQLQDRRTRAGLSQADLAVEVNQWLAKATGSAGRLDGEAIARYERGAVRWPGERYRQALRAVLRMPGEDALDDRALGFRKGWQRPYSQGASAPAFTGSGKTPHRPTGRGMGTPMSEDAAKPVPPGIDLERPNAARVYDYLLGGTANWAIDRVFADEAAARFPVLKPMARANRAFLGRVVRHCVRQGVRQFLDIGSGVPTVGNVHEVADAVDRGSRCVYVDYEPVAVAHSRALLAQEGDPRRHVIIQARMESADEVWEQALATGILDPGEPVCLIMLALLHFIPDQHVWPAMQRYRALLPPGSRLAISHLSVDGVPEDLLPQVLEYLQSTQSLSTPVLSRSFEEIQRLFGDFELEPPGLVWLPEWRLDGDSTPAMPDDFVAAPAKSCGRGGVAIKR